MGNFCPDETDDEGTDCRDEGRRILVGRSPRQCSEMAGHIHQFVSD